MNLFRTMIAGFGFLALFALCLFSQNASGTSKAKQLRRGAVRPPSEVATINSPGRLEILMDGKWAYLRPGIFQVPPGTYVVSITAMCGHPRDYPPAHPPVPSYLITDYLDSFTAAAGDTVTYTIGLGDYPLVSERGLERGNFHFRPGTTCYGEASVYHTVTKNSTQRAEDAHDDRGARAALVMSYLDRQDRRAHVLRPLGPAATLVMNYLDAREGATDQSDAKVFLSADCEGGDRLIAGASPSSWKFVDSVSRQSCADMVPEYRGEEKSEWRFSASNTKIFSEEINADGGRASILAEIVFTAGPPRFKGIIYIFSLVLESGAWKISRIALW